MAAYRIEYPIGKVLCETSMALTRPAHVARRATWSPSRASQPRQKARTLCVVDRGGRKRTLLEWEHVNGVLGVPAGDEVFAGGLTRQRYDIKGVNLSSGPRSRRRRGFAGWPMSRVAGEFLDGWAPTFRNAMVLAPEPPGNEVRGYEARRCDLFRGRANAAAHPVLERPFFERRTAPISPCSGKARPWRFRRTRNGRS